MKKFIFVLMVVSLIFSSCEYDPADEIVNETIEVTKEEPKEETPVVNENENEETNSEENNETENSNEEGNEENTENNSSEESSEENPDENATGNDDNNEEEEEIVIPPAPVYHTITVNYVVDGVTIDSASYTEVEGSSKEITIDAAAKEGNTTTSVTYPNEVVSDDDTYKYYTHTPIEYSVLMSKVKETVSSRTTETVVNWVFKNWKVNEDSVNNEYTIQFDTDKEINFIAVFEKVESQKVVSEVHTIETTKREYAYTTDDTGIYDENELDLVNNFDVAKTHLMYVEEFFEYFIDKNSSEYNNILSYLKNSFGDIYLNTPYDNIIGYIDKDYYKENKSLRAYECFRVLDDKPYYVMDGTEWGSGIVYTSMPTVVYKTYTTTNIVEF